VASVETDQWRRKYFEALREIEQDEKRWQAIEDLLRRIVGRLCIAARGVDPALDRELDRLGPAVRQSQPAAELEALLVSLSAAITALDQRSRTEEAAVGRPRIEPPAGSVDAGAATVEAPRIEGLLQALLDRLDLLPELLPQVAALREQLSGGRAQDDLTHTCSKIADLVNLQRSQLERDKAHVAAILQQVTGKLDEIASYLVREASDQETARGSSDELNRQVLSEVRSIDLSVKQATDLSALQVQVRSRLDAINVHLLEFRNREEARISQYRERADAMRKRIAELEKETDLLQRSLQQKAKQVMTDPLTGLPNRLAYDERIAQAVRRRKRSGGVVCVAAWDIDWFKRINDRYGHQAGDKVLQIIGQHLARSVRETDFVSRYGGEEFVMILEGAPLTEAFGLVERLREAAARIGFHFRGEPVSVTVSCGITELRDDDDPESAFVRADRLLYQAKNAGRNRCLRDA
jgi:diguanylate cyclase